MLGAEISSRKPAPNVEVLTGILLVERNRYHRNRQRRTLTIGSDFNDNRISAGILLGYSFIGLNSVNALNMTSPNNMTDSANMTGSNMTMSNASGSSAKMHLEEGIKALKSGDNQAAMTHLDAARAAMVPGGQLIILNKE